MRTDRFDDIRPFYEEEIPAAMQRIAANSLLPLISSFVFPDKEVNEVRKMVAGIDNIRDFQHKVMYVGNRRVMEQCTDGFSFSGEENIPTERKCLYVSNHRDIMLDAAFFQNILIDKGMDTTEITFGANLMTHPLIVDIGKSNKMFKVVRGGNPREFYSQLLHLSEYIRYTILENGSSVWIAQRNGRTKDGNDITDQGIVKMFGVSSGDDKVEALDSLHIVPIAVSYEWEPCDLLKALELYEASFHAYTKKPGEDINSIITGIMAQKGRVHFHICRPIAREELMRYDALTANAYHREVAALIDRRIYDAYRLFPNNYIAHDIRYGQNRFSGEYTPEQKERFLEHLSMIDKYESCDHDALRDILLGIYSNPVENKLKNNIQ